MLQLRPKIAHHQPGWMALFILISLVIGWYLVLGIGVYSGRWQGPKTQAVLRRTPLPAAMVGWRPLSYRSYLDQYRAIVHYTTYLQTSTGGVYQAQTTSDISATTMNKMVRLAASELAMKNLHISVTAGDINQAYNSQLLQNGDAEHVKTTIMELYGWSPEQFKQNVIRPAIIRDKLQEKLSFDESISATAKTQAQAVLGLVTAGDVSFADLAKKYSDDVYGTNGGDVGFVKQGEQAKEIDDAAFSLDVNEVSGIIHTKFGYHIIKPIERKNVDGVDQVHLLQITILAPQVDDYLTVQLKKTSVQIFIPDIGWDAQNARAVKK